MAGRQLADGFDVVIGQYLARTEFLEELEQLAAEHGARFVDAVLVLDERTLRTRLAGRRERPGPRAMRGPGRSSERSGISCR